MSLPDSVDFGSSDFIEDYDDYDPDDAPDPDDSAPFTWSRTELWTNPDGSISGVTTTNDNLDRGYPTETASWAVSYRDLADVAARYRSSSPWWGVLGCEVSVFLDGEHWDPARAA